MAYVINFDRSGTRSAAHRLRILFGLAGLKATELHSSLTQVQRLDVSKFCKVERNLNAAFCFVPITSVLSIFCSKESYICLFVGFRAVQEAGSGLFNCN